MSLATEQATGLSRKHANKSSIPGQSPEGNDLEALAGQARYRERVKRLDQLRGVTSLPRIRKCLWTPRGGEVGCRLNGAAGTAAARASFTNLITCGSVWACPVHAARIGGHRATEIAQGIRYVIEDLDGAVVFLSITVRHNGSQSLTDKWNAVQAGWGFATKGRPWAELGKRYGRIGFTRGLDATWGERNGWHPHLHVLLYFDRPLGPLAAADIGERFTESYRAGLRKVGYDIDPHIGVKAEVATTRRDADGVLGRYMAHIAHEITRNDTKSGTQTGRYAPFELLREGLDAWLKGPNGAAPDNALLRAWREWEQSSHGRRQLTWSQGFRKLVGIGAEATDQELADQEIAGADFAGLPFDSWTRVRPYRRELRQLIEDEGQAAFLAVLDAWGIPWHRSADVSEVEAWRADPDLIAPIEAQKRREWREGFKRAGHLPRVHNRPA